MIVVSDTTPLISLMKIGRLDLIERLFGEVQIPTLKRYPDWNDEKISELLTWQGEQR